LEGFKVRETIAGWMQQASDRGDLEQHGEHEQVWAETVELLQQMVDVMGEERVTLADFVQILDSGLAEFDLALAPPTLDQVLVGSVDRTRTSALQAVIVMGLSEGEFPRAPSDATLFSDGDRLSLRRKQIDIDPDGKRRLLDESFLGYIAFTRPSKKLIVTRPLPDDQARPLAPSIFWRKLRQSFPELLPTVQSRDTGSTLETIGSPRQLITALMNRVRTGPSKKHAAAWASLYQWLATRECSSDAIDVMRFRAWRALKYDNKATLSPAIAAQLLRDPLRASVSRIETFAACPFKHFARYGLRLREREDNHVTAIDLGNVYHGILEQLVRELVRSRKEWASISESQLKAATREVGASLRGELMLSTARNQYLLGHIEKTVGRVIASQDAVANRGKFRAKWGELKFGPGEGLPALVITTPAGKQVHLSGKIDRVDMLTTQEKTAVAVIDYKLSRRSLSLDEVYHGLSLQLLTYLLVLQAGGEKLDGQKLTPAAAFYVRLLRQIELVPHPSEAPDPHDPQYDLRVKPRGLLNREYLGAIDSELTIGTSRVVQGIIKQDGGIGNRKKSDLAEPQEFAALLDHVRAKIGKLTDQILDGQIDVRPYRMGEVSPCPNCEYRAVCRFEFPTNEYLDLNAPGREKILDLLTGKATDEQ